MPSAALSLEDFYWYLGNYIHYHLNVEEEENSDIFKYILGKYYAELIFDC